jgi:long-chain acyl-CoA synthetase
MSPPARTVPAFLADAARRHGSLDILQDREGTVTLDDLLAEAARAAEGLRRAGVKQGDRVGFYADNSRRWILTDLAIQLVRAVSVPRGTDTPVDEMAELFAHAEVGLVFAHAARHAKALEGVRDRVPTMGEIICIDPKDAPGRTLDDLIEAGADAAPFAEQGAAVEPEDLATIIYTSGTTGRPKGVMLTQANFGHQIANGPPVFRIGPAESFLSVLPPWHIFERTVEYLALCSAAKLVYTNRRHFKDDLGRYEPTFVPSVPRIWETVYNGVQKKLASGPALNRWMFKAAYAAASVRTRCWDRVRGHVLRIRKPHGLGLVREGLVRAAAGVGLALSYVPDAIGRAVVFSKMRKLVGSKLRGAISGGGLMPAHIDRFLRTIELPVLVGYGLTETSPVVCVRRMDRNVLGTIGVALPEVEMEIRSPETGEKLGPGEIGVICVRGALVMKGYYKDEALTRKAIDDDGWFDTGDLGFVTEEGDLCFHGRLKETIVLKGGENIEPTAVEEAIVGSPYVQQVIVVGQDRKVLAALVVPEPTTVGPAVGLGADATCAELADREDARELIRQECIQRTSGRKGWERIGKAALLPEPLEETEGLLTQTLKPRRHVIVEHYADRIEEAYEQ